MAEDNGKNGEGALGALNGLWNGITQVAEDARIATEGGLRQIPGIPANERNKEWIAKVFKEFDKDKNNVIDEKELQDFAFSLGETWSEETCKKVFEKLDTDKSGGLSLDEFAAWFLTPGAISEVCQGDDMLTKIALGPKLFARHAQRKANEALSVGTSTLLAEQLRRQVEEASRRISIDNVKAVHEKYSKGNKDGITLDVFKQALAEIRQEFEKISDEEAEKDFIDMDVENNKALDIDEFRRALQKPFPIEQAVSALPLSRVIASALPGLPDMKIEEHLEAFSKLRDDEVSAMASAVSYELEKLLLDMVRDLRKGYEVRNSGTETGSDAGAKFSAVLSGGKVEDFHAGLAQRVGELRSLLMYDSYVKFQTDFRPV
jgi:Ca2+-binding EF-hand superfamily protein